ncbi:MAG: tetratricopeptide repeat protein [Opitutaceae bacterium]
MIAYLPALRAGFVWDDDTFLTQNPLIRAADGLRRFWATAEATDYWPVTSTTLWVEWRLWGMHAAGYHATNLLLHIAECLLLWRILALLRIPGAYLAALIFAVHPVNVESVAWIAQRKNLLAMLFFLASIYCFIKAEEATPAPAGGGVGEGGRKWYWLSLASFIFALLSKGSVATLPLVLLGIVAWRRRVRKRDIFHLSPFFLAAAVFAGLDVWFQGHGSAEVIRSAGPLERTLGAGGVIWFYLYKAIWPLNLIFVYPQWHIDPTDWRWWLPLLSAVAVTFLLLRRAVAKSENGAIRSPLLAAWLYFCVMLVPVMGLTSVYFMKYSLVADHYQHLALIGVAAFAGAAWARWRFGGSAAVATAAVCALACLTWRQCLNYRDAETLYRATIAANPECWLAHNNLGVSYQRGGEWAKAIEEYQEALRLRPNDAELHNNLGAVWLKMPERSNDAIGQIREALRLKPDFAEAHHNLGMALAPIPGRLPEAIAQYEEALRLKPDYAEAHYHLAIALGQVPGRLPEAIAQYEEALRLKPDYVEAHHDLALTLAQIPSRLPEAIAQYQEALRLKPDYAEAHFHLAIALTQIPGRMSDAVAHYEEALRLKPDYTEVHNNLGAALAQIPGRMPEAITQFEEALRLRPDNAGAHYNLALAYADTGRLDEAIRHLQMALRLNPNFDDARRNLERLQASGGANSDNKPR